MASQLQSGEFGERRASDGGRDSLALPCVEEQQWLWSSAEAGRLPLVPTSAQSQAAELDFPFRKLLAIYGHT